MSTKVRGGGLIRVGFNFYPPSGHLGSRPNKDVQQVIWGHNAFNVERERERESHNRAESDPSFILVGGTLSHLSTLEEQLGQEGVALNSSSAPPAGTKLGSLRFSSANPLTTFRAVPWPYLWEQSFFLLGICALKAFSNLYFLCVGLDELCTFCLSVINESVFKRDLGTFPPPQLTNAYVCAHACTHAHTHTIADLYQRPWWDISTNFKQWQLEKCAPVTSPTKWHLTHNPLTIDITWTIT